MPKWIVDLNFYGPYGSIGALRNGLKDGGHTRAIYLARSARGVDLRREAGLEPRASEADYGLDEARVAYVGLTAAKSMSSRFSNHHAIGDRAMEDRGLSRLDSFYAGYLHRAEKEPEAGKRHETRLTVAEDMLIAWFLPPLNKHGVDRRHAVEETWSKTLVSASVHFYWWSPEGESLPQGIPGFPKALTYVARSETFTAIW